MLIAVRLASDSVKPDSRAQNGSRKHEQTVLESTKGAPFGFRKHEFLCLRFSKARVSDASALPRGLSFIVMKLRGRRAAPANPRGMWAVST